MNREVGVCGEVLGIQKKERGGAVVIHHLEEQICHELFTHSLSPLLVTPHPTFPI